jgi:prepilin peptidase dependent protein A
MPAARSSSRNAQRGDAMLEALIAMVLLGVIGLGLSYAAARTLYGQRYLNTQNMAVTQLRQALQQTGVTALCIDGVAPSALHMAGNDFTLDFSCQRGNVTISLPDGSNAVTLSGATAPVTALSLSTPSTAASRALFGGDGRIAVQP